jgi:hypothetical protein
MIDLMQQLSKGMPGLEKAIGMVFANTAAVCLENQSHSPGVLIFVDGTFSSNETLTWTPVTSELRDSYKDLQEATEWGASGVAIVLLEKFAGLVVLERSIKGTGFDYWMGLRGVSNQALFQGKARLEVSGILRGDEKTLTSRVKKKRKQVGTSTTAVPAYVAVIEFGQPKGRVTKT